MNISKIFPHLYNKLAKDIFISGIKLVSKNINKGDVFICLEEGLRQQATLSEAVKRGASCLFTSGESASETSFEGIPLFKVENIRQVLTYIASSYYPHNLKNVIGVTGTYGKTSTVSFIRQIFTLMGERCASLGSQGLWIENHNVSWVPQIITTPPAFHLYYILHYLSSQNLRHFVMEVTSHGLSRHRVDAISFQVGVFTNLTESHLDYHKDMENYYYSKRRFFSEILQPGSVAVLPHDQEWSEDILSICRSNHLKPIIIGQDIRLEKTVLSQHGTESNIMYFGKKMHLHFPHLSGFQINNLLFALGALAGADTDLHSFQSLIQHIQSPVGRMELIATVNDAPIFVDYAHRPEAFENILKPFHNAGKEIILVFGCGGGGHKELRRELGRIAYTYAKKIIITDDNARDEDPLSIRQMIKEGCPDALEISCRKQAIKEAISSLQPNCVCIIAGRGDEDVQVIGKKSIPFKDKEEILKAIQCFNQRKKGMRA